MARRRMLLAPYLAVGETVAGDWLWGAQSLDGGMYPGAGEGVLALTELRALHVDERTRQLTSVDRWDIDDVLVTKAPVPLMRLVMLQTQERTVSFVLSRSAAKTIRKWAGSRPSSRPAVVDVATRADGPRGTPDPPTVPGAPLEAACDLAGLLPTMPSGRGRIVASPSGVKVMLRTGESVELAWDELESFQRMASPEGDAIIMLRSRRGTNSWMAAVHDADLDLWGARLQAAGVPQRQ